MHSHIYSGFTLIFAILRNFRVPFCARRANIVFYLIGQKKVTLGPLFTSENDKNRACVIKNILCASRSGSRMADYWPVHKLLVVVTAT